MKIFKIISLISILIFSESAFSQQLYEFTASKYLMGTKFDITAVYTSVDTMKKAIYYSLREVERIQQVMSNTIDGSEISAINRMSGIRPVKTSYETYSIIERSIAFADKYPGFDITIGPITNLWGFNGDNPPVSKVPPKNVIDSLVKLVDDHRIVLNPNDTSVYLPVKGMMIDLGGIAKGYAVDRASAIMKRWGINSFFVNGGGDLYVSGYKSVNQRWTIGIEHPRKSGDVLGVMEANDIAVGSSGDYERFVIIDGIRYHHIMNIKSGYPVFTSQAATAIAATTEEAVVLSKYLFILGIERFKNELPNVPGLVVDSLGVVYYNEKLKEQYGFELKSSK